MPGIRKNLQVKTRFMGYRTMHGCETRRSEGTGEIHPFYSRSPSGLSTGDPFQKRFLLTPFASKWYINLERKMLPGTDIRAASVFARNRSGASGCRHIPGRKESAGTKAGFLKRLAEERPAERRFPAHEGDGVRQKTKKQMEAKK